jgi:FtsP/CotA-like multicopper oxidase with cupredoxin domain
MSQVRINRRSLLCGAAGGLAGAALGPLGFPAIARATAPLRELAVRSRVIEVQGRAATVFGILDETGRPGLDLYRSEGFHVRLRNDSAEPTIIHWHGLTPPFGLDGNPLSQPPMAAGGSADYAFDLTHPGTHWMHSHFGLQEQRLLAAPLIVRDDAERGIDRQDVVMLLHDFSFTPPEEILARLTSGQMAHVGSGSAAMEMGAGGMDHSAMGHAMPGMNHGGASQQGIAGMDHGAAPSTGGHGMGAMDLNDVAFDAFLVNDRDLSDPEVVTVERGGRVRLRIINAAASTNFWIDLGPVTGTLVAVDGRAVQPVIAQRFEIAMAQRLDIEFNLPSEAVALPVLAQREGDRARTGLVLATAGARVERITGEAPAIAPPVLLDLERKLVAAEPLPDRASGRRLATDLTGSMAPYAWSMDDRGFVERVPLEVRAGERVELTFVNRTMMSHPMHLHGHHFQIVGLGRTRLSGAIRDTVLVPAMESVTIAFDADNPGDWPLHCHNLYHMAAGMMTSLRYA